jgi:hypothetical protein
VTVSCGSGGGKAAPTRAEWASAVNRLCLQSLAQRRTLVPSTATPKALTDALQQSVAIDEELQHQIAAIQPPASFRRDVRRLLDLETQQHQVILQLVVAINHADAQSTDTLYARLDELGSQLRPLLDRLGLTKCTEKV